MQSRYNTPFRRLVRISAGLAIITLLLYSFIDPVAAKGPQSAIITGPGIDRPIELIDRTVENNPDLVVRLMEQTGLWFATGDLPLPLEKPAGDLGPAYTLSWINSGPPDKSVDERTIRQLLYLDAENGPLIHTPAQESLQGWGPGVIGWFAAPSGLRDTLAELGVPVARGTSSGGGTFTETASSTTLPDREPAGALWLLGIAAFALVAGLAGALGARHIVRLGEPASRHLRDS